MPSISKPRRLKKAPAAAPSLPSATKGSQPTSSKKNAPVSMEDEVAKILKTVYEKRVKISAETLKKLFTAEKKSDDIKKLVALLSDRTKDGRRFGLKNWRVHAAIDEAYRASFHQITPTIIGKILSGDKRLTAKEIVQELERWGLSEATLFTEIEDPKNPTQKTKILNRETFHKILVPLVKSYINAREAKLFNDRDNNPFFSYSPMRQTEESEVIGNIITQLVETMSTAYGFKSTLRAMIHQALKYSFAVMFPVESWHFESKEDEDGKEVTDKEGLRYNIPHPTRCGWDQTHRPSTFNTDTGCEWGCYWQLLKYGDVDSNSAFYNKDKISYGTCWFGEYETYFKEVYPCTIAHPIPVGEWKGNREKEATLYSSNDNDKALFLTNMYCKLSPKQWGLGEYKHKIWFRFVMASDDTVVFAEPIPFRPILYLGTDADDSTSNSTASFGLEILPWQDLTGNILSQHLLSVKQNLVKIIPYDKDQITESQIREIEARGKESVSVTWFPFSSRESKVAQVDPSTMFKPITLGNPINTAEIISTLVQVFNIMERALGISAQEVGAIAGHIQTAEEIRTVSSNTSSRVEFMGTFVDEFIDAWKRQIYEASQAFMDEDFVVYVNGVDQALAGKLKEKYGFELSELKGGKVEIKGKKTKLSVNAFISTREGKTRLNQPQIAQVLMQAVQAVAANPELAAKIGADQIVKLLNRASQLAGAPEDSGFKILPEATQLAELKALQAQVEQFAKQISDQATQQATAAATQTVTSQVAPVVKKVAEMAQGASETADQAGAEAQNLGQQLQQLSQIVLKLDALAKSAAASSVSPGEIPIQQTIAA